MEILIAPLPELAPLGKTYVVPFSVFYLRTSALFGRCSPTIKAIFQVFIGNLDYTSRVSKLLPPHHQD